MARARPASRGPDGRSLAGRPRHHGGVARRADHEPAMSPRLNPLNEQVVVITGASSGIGLATARAAAGRAPASCCRRATGRSSTGSGPGWAPWNRRARSGARARAPYTNRRPGRRRFARAGASQPLHAQPDASGHRPGAGRRRPPRRRAAGACQPRLTRASTRRGAGVQRWVRGTAGSARGWGPAPSLGPERHNKCKRPGCDDCTRSDPDRAGPRKGSTGPKPRVNNNVSFHLELSPKVPKCSFGPPTPIA